MLPFISNHYFKIEDVLSRRVSKYFVSILIFPCDIITLFILNLIIIIFSKKKGRNLKNEL